MPGAVGQHFRAPEHKGAIAQAIGSLCRRERENRPTGAKRPDRRHGIYSRDGVTDAVYLALVLKSPSDQLISWLNSNQGLVSVALFLATILFGWVSGIFSALRRRPKFKIGLIDGPTFACTFGAPMGEGISLVHRTGIALYLHIANVGSAPSSIQSVAVGYHWALVPFSRDWLRYRVGWFWLRDQTVCMQDFQSQLGESLKLYPFLTQASFVSGFSAESYLQIGQSVNGVAYFEQSDSWGGCFPLSINKKVAVKIGIQDVFGKWHYRKLVIPKVTLEEARRYNPSFGLTLATLRGGGEPFELATDDHGNVLPIQPPRGSDEVS